MLLRTITLTVVLLGLFTYANAAEITPYGSFNYKWSNDENSSGVSVNKLEDNGSKIGIDIDDIGVEGQTIIGFAKLEVGVDTDDSGSDTFDSRLAYVGLSGEVGDLSVGRQSHPFTDKISGHTDVFNVYGSNADFNYASRSSNTIAFSTESNGISFSALGLVNGTTGANDQDGIDEYEWAASAKVLGSEISIGYADDINSDISYWGAGATKTLGPLTVGSSYTIKDAATALTGYDLTATTTLSLGDLTVGYGDKEGTGEYYTYGINKEIGSSLKVFAEMQDANLDTNVDTRSWSIGTKFSF